MNIEQFQDLAGWAVAALLGTGMGVRTYMTMWSKERAIAAKSDVLNERAHGEIDVIVLLREQVELLRVSNNERADEMSVLRGLMHAQSKDIGELHAIVNRLKRYVGALEATLAANGIATPTNPTNDKEV